jgi:hypothetical protein
MTTFHTDEYIDFLTKVTPDTFDELTWGKRRCMYSSFMGSA